jgi:hypothetical protein
MCRKEISARAVRSNSQSGWLCLVYHRSLSLYTHICNALPAVHSVSCLPKSKSTILSNTTLKKHRHSPAADVTSNHRCDVCAHDQNRSQADTNIKIAGMKTQLIRGMLQQLLQNPTFTHEVSTRVSVANISQTQYISANKDITVNEEDPKLDKERSPKDASTGASVADVSQEQHITTGKGDEKLDEDSDQEDGENRSR